MLKYRMIGLNSGELKCCPNVFSFKVRKVGEYFLLWDACSQKIQHVLDSYAHPSDTGTAAALIRIHRDAVKM